MSALTKRSKAGSSFASMMTSDSEPDFDDFGFASHNTARDIAKKVTGAKSSHIRVTSPADRVVKRAVKIGRHLRHAHNTSEAPTARPALRDKSNTNTNALGYGRGTKVGTKDRSRGPLNITGLHLESDAYNTIRARNEHHGTHGGKSLAIHDSMEAELVANDAYQESTGELEMSHRGLARVHAAQMKESSTHIRSQDDARETTAQRRLRDAMEKYECLQSRHDELRDIGVKAAERNFERLKNQMDENTATSNLLIQQLKDELASESALVRDGQRMRQQLQASENSVAEMEGRIVELAASLQQANAEIKALSMKLAANRANEASSKAPGSVIEIGSGSGRKALTTSSQTVAAQAKEDLYGDLTGLIIRGLACAEEETVYDCIQTGRNGTLHFKLGLCGEGRADSYEDAQFTYRPQLDEERDRDLIELLPDYLVEEISFPRAQAAKFYSRVNRSLTERLS